MSGQAPETPIQVEAALRRCVTRIAEGVRITNTTYRQKQQALRELDRAFARAYLQAAGPSHEKRYRAELDTVMERDAYDAADAAHRYAEAQARALRDELDSLRSQGASIREAYRNAGAS